MESITLGTVSRSWRSYRSRHKVSDSRDVAALRHTEACICCSLARDDRTLVSSSSDSVIDVETMLEVSVAIAVESNSVRTGAK